MFGGPPPPPPPPPPAEAGATPRYVYLLSRLRGRQITIEEATELFAIMQGMIRASSVAATASAPPATAAAGAPPGRPTPAVGLGDADWLLLLGLGAGLGMSAALLKAFGSPPPGRARRAGRNADG